MKTRYSIVEIKNTIEKDAKEKEMVTVKGIGSARWAGHALFIIHCVCENSLEIILITHSTFL